MADTTKTRGLGRGLAALVAEFPGSGTVSVEIEVDRIRANARQPRRTFDDTALNGLVESIRADGLVQPIVVRDTGDGFEIIAGERRWRAARQAGLATIPAVVRQADEREALILALAENVAREDLNAVELARAYAVLADELDLSQTEIARRVGRSRPSIANTIRLLELPDDALALIAAGELSEGHGRALLLASGQDERLALARRAIDRGWSVRDTEAAARGTGRAKPKPARRAGRWTRSWRTWPLTPHGSRSTCARRFARARAAAVSRSTSRARPSWDESSTSSGPSACPGPTERWYPAVALGRLAQSVRAPL